jgi:glycosyltransferase involved in cell wall biosynthesis
MVGTHDYSCYRYLAIEMGIDKAEKVIVNGRALGRRLTGVERYAGQVLRQLKDRVQVIRPPRALSGPVGHAWEQICLPLSVGPGSILWSPANTGPLAVSRQVITIHDLSPLDHPEWFHPAFARLYSALLPRLVTQSLAVIVPSRFTRERLRAYSWSRRAAIFVIPAGVDRRFFYPRSPREVEAVRERYGLPSEYLLAVGSLQPRKNLSALLAAWKTLSASRPQLGLAIVGASAPHFCPALNAPAPHGTHFLGYVPDRDLPALYSGALALVSPSLYEGFGLPLLEAMACGTPPAASNCGALPELVADCGLLFDPRQPQAIEDCIARLVANPDLRRDLARSGLARTRGFDWSRTAQSVWEVMESTCEIRFARRLEGL